MRSVRTVVKVLAILALAGAAHAEVRNYVVADSAGAASCAPKRDPDGYLQSVDPGQLTVNVEFPAGTTPSVTDVVMSAAGVNITPTINGNAAKAVLGGSNYKPGVKVKVDAIFKAKPLPCGAFETAAAPAAGPASDLEAQRFLTSITGQAELAEVRRAATKSILLTHLPSGRVAFPYPASVSESDTLQAVLVADLSVPTGAILNVDSCPDRDPFRILGDFSALAAKKQALETTGAPPPRFAVVPIGAAFQCGAGKIVYTAAQATPAIGSGQAGPPPATTMRVRPIYHLAATFIYAFDFQNQSTFSVKSQKVAGQIDRVGPTLDVGFTWFPGGVDYEQMKGHNHWLNPFLVFDVKAPQENFASGLGFTVSGGLSVAVGASFHKSTILDGKVVGDAFTGDGTVPTRKVWDSKSIGFFVGVALDSAVFGKVKGLWGATNHSQ
jgi:hypothetical protein